MSPNLLHGAWKKSSYSGGEGGNCVEMAKTPKVAAVRDSKNPAGPMLVFRDLAGFLDSVKAGRFDR